MSAYAFISAENNTRTYADFFWVKCVSCESSADGFRVLEGYLSSAYQWLISPFPFSWTGCKHGNVYA